MARSRARVRVFSDDGHCVADARVMRRALEYVKAFGGVISQHAQDPRLAGPDACCHESELSGRLGLPGWPGVAEESIVARDVMLARHTGSRVHVAHVSTAGSVEVHPLGQGAGHRRHRRGDAAPPAADPRPARRRYDPVWKVNPPLRPEEDVARAPRGASPTAPSTRSPPTTRRTPGTTRSTPSSTRPSGCSGWRRRSRWSARSWSHAGAARLGRRRPRHVGQPGPDRPARRATASRSPSGQPANLTLVDPTATWTVDRDASHSLSRNNPWHGRDADRPRRRDLHPRGVQRPRRPRPHPRARRRPL